MADSFIKTRIRVVKSVSLEVPRLDAYLIYSAFGECCREQGSDRRAKFTSRTLLVVLGVTEFDCNWRGRCGVRRLMISFEGLIDAGNKSPELEGFEREQERIGNDSKRHDDVKIVKQTEHAFRLGSGMQHI
jgi:hypothetical protein